MTRKTTEPAEMPADDAAPSKPIEEQPTTGGRFSRDPKTGALTRLED